MFVRARQLFHSLSTRTSFVWMGLILLLCGCTHNPKMPQQEASGYEACWPCAVYETTFEVLERTLETLIEISCKNAVTLLGFGLLFWLLFHVGKFVVTIQEPNIRKFIFPITTVLFKSIVVFSLIHNADDYINFIGEYIVQPIFLFFADVATLIFDSDNTVRQATLINSVSDEIGSGGRLFGTGVGKFIDIIFRIFIGFKFGTALGFTIWSGIGAIPFLFGLFVICMFWMLLLTMPLMFTDSLIRIAVILILSPFILVAWIFPPTKKMFEKLWGIFIGTGLTLIFASFYVTLTLYLVITFAEQQYPGILSNAVQQNDPDLYYDVLSIKSSVLGFFVLLLAMNRLSKHISRIANQFGGETASSSWFRMFGGLKQLSIAVSKAVLAVALASPSLAKDAANEVKDITKSIAQDGSKTGSS